MKGFRLRGFPPLAEAVVSANLIGQDPFHEKNLIWFNFLDQVNASFDEGKGVVRLRQGSPLRMIPSAFWTDVFCFSREDSRVLHASFFPSNVHKDHVLYSRVFYLMLGSARFLLNMT